MEGNLLRTATLPLCFIYHNNFLRLYFLLSETHTMVQPCCFWRRVIVTLKFLSCLIFSSAFVFCSITCVIFYTISYYTNTLTSDDSRQVVVSTNDSETIISNTYRSCQEGEPTMGCFQSQRMTYLDMSSWVLGVYEYHVCLYF